MVWRRQGYWGGLRFLGTATLTVLALMAGSARAEEATGDWEPAPPMPDEFDWVQLVSNEWLKGEIIAMYKESLEFDSDELDDLTLDFGDIKQIRSAGIMQVGLVGGGVAIGKLLMDGDEVRVMGEKDEVFERAQVLSITSGEPRERNYWTAKFSAGVNLRGGNSDQVESNARVGVKRRTVKNRIELDYLGNYSTTNDVTAADNQRVSFAWDRFVTDRFFLSPVLAEYYRDPFQNIASRGTIGAGAGYQVVDTSKIDWQATVGFAYQGTRFDDVVEGEPGSASTPALVVGTAYDHELSGSVDFNVEYRFFIVDEESGQYTHHFVTGFEFDLIGSLDFDITLVWDRIEKPRSSSDGAIPLKDDYRLNFALSFDF